MHVLAVADLGEAPALLKGSSPVDGARPDADRGVEPISRRLDPSVEHLLSRAGRSLNPVEARVAVEELRRLNDAGRRIVEVREQFQEELRSRNKICVEYRDEVAVAVLEAIAEIARLLEIPRVRSAQVGEPIARSGKTSTAGTLSGSHRSTRSRWSVSCKPRRRSDVRIEVAIVIREKASGTRRSQRTVREVAKSAMLTQTSEYTRTETGNSHRCSRPKYQYFSSPVGGEGSASSDAGTFVREEVAGDPGRRVKAVCCGVSAETAAGSAVDRIDSRARKPLPPVERFLYPRERPQR